MKIECDKCGAKYSIADEKVRGKTFKIRCKRCSNVIIVRDKAAAESAADEAPQPEAEAPAGWHIAVDGETVGPISEEDVRARYSAGEVDKETAVWQEGFEDWVPLSEVDTFADLPDQPASSGADFGGGAAAGLAAGAAASADDPFGASSDEDFGASEAASSGGGFSAPAPAAEPDPAPASPRVSSSNLTGQRNENSVLFSLENLQAMAGSGGGGGGGGSAAPAKTKIATSAPTSEGSGLIDIRAMGAMFDSGSGGGGDAPAASGGGEDEANLPSFGGGGFGGLSASPLVTPQAEAPVEAKVEEKKASNGPLYIIIGLLALGLIGFVVWAFVLPKPEEEKEEPVAAATPSVEDAAKDAELEEMRKALEELKKAQEAGTKSAEEVAAMEAQVAEAEEAAGTEGSSKSGSKRKKSSGGSGSTTKKASSSSSSSSGSTATKETPKTNSADDVDCLLNPGLAKCKGGSSTKKSSSGSSTAATGGTGPAKLGTSDLLAGISKVKSAAKACGPKHGVSGKKVPVKMSIAGSTGKVTSATATGEFAGTAVGNCAAAALKNATFKTFQAPSQGFTYKVPM